MQLHNRGRFKSFRKKRKYLGAIVSSEHRGDTTSMADGLMSIADRILRSNGSVHIGTCPTKSGSLPIYECCSGGTCKHLTQAEWEQLPKITR